MQSAFYPTVAQEYGVPLDTRDVYTKCISSLVFPFQKRNARTDLIFKPTGKCGPLQSHPNPQKRCSSPNSQTGSITRLLTVLLLTCTIRRRESKSFFALLCYPHFLPPCGEKDKVADTKSSFAGGPFVARPVVGGHFALLALNGAPTAASGKRDAEPEPREARDRGMKRAQEWGV